MYKEIKSGAVAKSYMRKGFLINEEMRKYARPLVISHMTLQLLHSEFAYSVYEQILIFFFISVCTTYCIYHALSSDKFKSFPDSFRPRGLKMFDLWESGRFLNLLSI